MFPQCMAQRDLVGTLVWSMTVLWAPLFAKQSFLPKRATDLLLYHRLECERWLVDFFKGIDLC